MNCNGLCTLEQQNYVTKINLGKDEPKLKLAIKMNSLYQIRSKMLHGTKVAKKKEKEVA